MEKEKISPKEKRLEILYKVIISLVIIIVFSLFILIFRQLTITQPQKTTNQEVGIIGSVKIYKVKLNSGLNLYLSVDTISNHISLIR